MLRIRDLDWLAAASALTLIWSGSEPALLAAEMFSPARERAIVLAQPASALCAELQDLESSAFASAWMLIFLASARPLLAVEEFSFARESALASSQPAPALFAEASKIATALEMFAAKAWEIVVPELLESESARFLAASVFAAEPATDFARELVSESAFAISFANDCTAFG